MRHFPHSDDRYPLLHDDVVVEDAGKPCQPDNSKLTKKRKKYVI